jgi:LmbE family N-acetylglucosaminyl deacetylase
VGTLVSVHAHPDDEAIACGGTLARAAAEGHRVVVVFATRGEHGEVADGVLDPGEELWERREREAHTAAGILGVHRVEFLGYVDSGMMGTPENDAPGSFWKADPEEAADRLAAIIEAEKADVLTIYDDNGTYGHPDHIQVHRVGLMAAERAGVERVYESVVDRDRARRWLDAEGSDDTAELLADLELPSPADLGSIGVPGELVTTRIDVLAYLDQKHMAMAAHASQIAETSFFLALPPALAQAVWGQEDYVLRGAPAGTEETWLFDA